VVVVQFENVSKRFRRQTVQPYTSLKTAVVDCLLRRREARREAPLQALKEITFTVQQGQTLGIIGRNGSGKSTLLKLVAGIYRPDYGSIAVHGKVGALLELGAGFHPEFSGRENVLINGVILGLSKREVRRRFDAIVRFAELEDFIDEPVKTYSSGMYARLGFAVIVHADLDVLLIDEILAVGDEQFQQKCFERLQALQQHGKTIILVSHVPLAVEQWCDEAVWLHEGIIRDRGTPTSVIQKYRAVTTTPDGQLATAISPQGDKPLPPETLDIKPERRGNREVELILIGLGDATGAERHTYRRGEQARVSIHYTVHRPIEAPVFRLTLLREDGLWCYGTDTAVDGVPLSMLGKEGTVEVLLERLDLLPGTYYVDVAVDDGDGQVYDYHHRLYKFVMTAEVHEGEALRIPHRWSIRPSLLGTHYPAVTE
jgi:homopolymeric O-antigen transport system ATP-binding protein